MIEVTVQPNGRRGETPMRIALCGYSMERGKNVVIVEVADAGTARRHFWAKRVSESGRATGLTWSRWIAEREAAGYEVIYQPAQTAKAA
ncbi:hypothetical protein [Erythrobacter aureus]|uniref:Uncharacterized protein n=1 Tax=Erythrobacter aureus TaxID=2182384 RepID=A0A345YJB4_9SPHN|nr:hypothetical protein [Erythrobacter aureus]AXK44016.1 hypothetical protein DVR09_16310 [Erythrobacter aureus]